MSVYVRELITDAFHGRTDDLTRLDLEIALDIIITSGAISRNDLLCMRLYLAGYTVDEIDLVQPNARDILIKCFSLLETVSEYKDEILIEKQVKRDPRLGKIKPYVKRLFSEASVSFS